MTSAKQLLRAAGESLRRPRRAQLVGGVLLAVLGFATVAQMQSTGKDDAYAGLRSADLVQLLNGLNAQSRRAETEITSLEKTRSQLTDRTQQRRAAVKQATTEASTLGILAGTIPATGPGLRITVTDPDDGVSLNNLLDGVEELRAAGAEAMEFNDSVRVVAQTSFEDTTGGLLVDGQRVTAPYVIDVIGPPTTLADTLDFVEGFAYDVKANGGDVTVKKLDKVTISSVTSRDSSQYADEDPQ